MNPAGLTLVVVVLVIGVAFILVMQARTKRPDVGEGRHDVRPDSTDQRFYGGVDRPAGPDAEDPTPSPEP